ncbi:DgyrCDS3966 [Dimorphilus gyrociliatus]|nr:DgyrCDS3966 [Dimorphilus gyrociliatus]
MISSAESEPPRLLSCGICWKTYSQPKILPCLHTFCSNCLMEYLPAESLGITCPVCRHQSILPQNGIEGLPNNNTLINLLSGSINDDQIFCPSHPKNCIELYCNECETAICYECTSAEHDQHEFDTIADAVNDQKKEMVTLVKEAKQRVPEIMQALKTIKKVKDELVENHTTAKRSALATFDLILNRLRQRRDLVLEDIKETFLNKEKALDCQRLALESTLKSVEQCSLLTENAIRSNKAHALLLVKKEVSPEIVSLCRSPLRCCPEENASLEFVAPQLNGLNETLESCGEVRTTTAVASESIAAGCGLRKCCVSKPTVVTVTTKDKQGRRVQRGGAELKATLTEKQTGLERKLPISDLGDGTYEIEYETSIPGPHVLDVTLYGDRLAGMPTIVSSYQQINERASSMSRIPRTATAPVKQRGVKRPSSRSVSMIHRRSDSNLYDDDLKFSIGNKGKNRGEFVNPQGVSSTPSGRILVADSNNQCIQSFGIGGEFKSRFQCSKDRIQRGRPTGIVVGFDGNYLVSDYENRWVACFSPTGNLVKKIGANKLLGPKGVCVTKAGNIAVVDNRACSILIFSSKGKLLYQWGNRGNAEHQLAGPHFIACTNDDLLVISDFHNHCVKVFEQDGTFRFAFGSNGEGNGQFNAPTGLAIDGKGNILVADWGNSRIQIFDSQGSFLSYINTSSDPLYGPQGLCMTSDGLVAVADSGNHCVKVYRYLQ